MKKIVLSLAALVAMSSVAFANEPVYEDEYLPEDKGLYLSLAYNHMSHDIDHEGLGTNVELDFTALMLDVGYKFNPYIAVEARYNFSLGDTDVDDLLESAEVSVLSFFVKPIYPIAPEMDIYLLLGYSLTDAGHQHDNISFDEGGFSWGAGAAYDVTEDFAVFADYTQFYNDTTTAFDHVVDGFNIGITYKF